MKIFVINPGSSSTKLALFEDDKCVVKENRKHDGAMLASFDSIVAQKDFRRAEIEDFASKNKIDFSAVDAFASRGGYPRPLEGGTYRINDALIDDLTHARYGEHACNLGPIIAKELGERYEKPSFITDPVSVDEMDDISRVTGVPGIVRASRFHALNHRAVAVRCARNIGMRYDEARLIVAHMGGGITVAVHDRGRVTDCTFPSDDGPICMDRPGAVPNTAIVRLCGEHTADEVTKILYGRSGIGAYLGTTDLIEIEKMAESGGQAQLLLRAMGYQIAKNICAFSASLYGHVDGIVLTGGMARSDVIVPDVTSRVKHIAPVFVFPGEFEMEALAEGTLRVLSGEEPVKVY